MNDVVGYRKRRGVEAFMLAFSIALGIGGLVAFPDSPLAVWALERIAAQ